MSEFVRIGSAFINKDTIKSLVIEHNCVQEENRYGIIELRASDIFIIVTTNEGTNEYFIDDDDINSWFEFIKTWYNTDDPMEYSGSLLRSSKIRQVKTYGYGKIVDYETYKREYED